MIDIHQPTKPIWPQMLTKKRLWLGLVSGLGPVLVLHSVAASVLIYTNRFMVSYGGVST